MAGASCDIHNLKVVSCKVGILAKEGWLCGERVDVSQRVSSHQMIYPPLNDFIFRKALKDTGVVALFFITPTTRSYKKNPPKNPLSFFRNSELFLEYGKLENCRGVRYIKGDPGSFFLQWFYSSSKCKNSGLFWVSEEILGVP